MPYNAIDDILDTLELLKRAVYAESADKADASDVAAVKTNPVDEIIKSLHQVKQAIQGRLSSKVDVFMQTPDADGVPFHVLSTEPAQIAQIKKILNALYHAEMALRISMATRSELTVKSKAAMNIVKDNANSSTLISAGSIALSSWFVISAIATNPAMAIAMVSTIALNPTMVINTVKGVKDSVTSITQTASSVARSTSTAVHHLYECLRLVLDAEIDVASVYEENLTALQSLVMPFISKELESGGYVLNNYRELSSRAGQFTGKGVNQLQHGVYTSIKHFMFSLPDLIAMLTGKISSEKPKSDEDVPTILARLDGIPCWKESERAESVKLKLEHFQSMLDKMDDMQVGGFCLAKSQYYQDVIRPVFALPVNILSQATQLHGASQNVILDKLKTLKNSVLPALAAFADKWEVNLISTPGLYSNSLMVQMETMYAQLIVRLQPVVDFSSHPELITLVDDDFIERRLAPAFQRWAECEKACLLLDDVHSTKLLATHRFTQELNADIIKYVLNSNPGNAVRAAHKLNQQSLNREIPARVADMASGICRVTIPANFDVYKNASKGVDQQLHQQRVKQKVIRQLQDRHSSSLSNERAPVRQDKAAEKRASRVVKKPVYSEAVAFLQEKKAGLFGIFNADVQQELKPRWHFTFRSKPLPFPELEDDRIMGQAKQLLSLKRLENCLYYLEKASVQLEGLDYSSIEIEFLREIAQTGNYIAQALALVKEIKADPWLSILAADLTRSIDAISKAVKRARGEYLPEAAEGQNVDAAFLGVNALILSLQKMDELQAGQRLSSDLVRANRHQIANRASADIKRIIEKSDGFFKLLLEAGTMSRLFVDLKGRLDGLCTESHEAVLKNLNDSALTAILLDVDQWEEKFLLAPGFLTHPLKEILDTYYQAILESCARSSEEHLTLATSMEPFNQRIRAIEQREAEAATKLEEIRILLPLFPHLKGEEASLIHALNAAKEKKIYLTRQQAGFNQAYFETFVTKSLDRQFEAACATKPAMHDLKPGIIADVVRGQSFIDVDKQVASGLTKAIQAFNRLETIKTAMAKLKDYIDAQEHELVANLHHGQSTSFESRKTLTAKRRLLTKMDRIVQCELSIYQKVEWLEKEIKHSDFQTTLLAYEHYDALTWGWLVQCVTAFLEFVGYSPKPERKVCYEAFGVASVGFFSGEREAASISASLICRPGI